MTKLKPQNFALPFDEKLEKQIIGTILLEPQQTLNDFSMLKSDMFYSNEYKSCFDAILSLTTKGIDIDLISVSKEGKMLKNALNIQILNDAYNSALSSSNFTYHCAVLKELFIRRELINFGIKTLSSGQDLSIDPLELMSEVQAKILNITSSLEKKQSKELSILVKNETEILLKEKDLTEENNKGIKTGFGCIDESLGGCFHNGELIIIAGSSGMGKTTFAFNVTRNASLLYGKKGAFFSLEMSEQQLAQKFIASESGVNYTDIRSGKIHYTDREKIVSASESILKTKIFIDDTSRLTPLILRSKATNLKLKYDIDFLVVDYLQLMEDDNRKGKSREQEVSELARSLKLLAKDLNIPVIALCQLSRAVDATSDKRPKLSHLRESGGIEQNADVVLFPFRPEYYKIMEFEDGTPTTNMAEIIFGKNRNGRVGHDLIGCDMAKSLFYDLNANKEYDINFDTGEVNVFSKIKSNFDDFKPF